MVGVISLVVPVSVLNTFFFFFPGKGDIVVGVR